MIELIKILKKAGKIAIEAQSKMAINIKSDSSIVTNGDILVSEFLEKELKRLYPDHDIFSEENTSSLPASNKVIVIDPIDGTESYSRKQDSWSILIGFVENGVPVGGVVYQPTLDLIYYGFKGRGAFKLTKGIISKLKARTSGELTGACSPKDYGEYNFLKNQNINNIQKLYSAALKIMMVADGQTDAYPNFRHKCSLWDLIAPQAILEESGGKMIYETPIIINFTKTHIDQKFCAVSKRLENLKIK